MIVLLDRDVDVVTPLCTQTTYEGLIDEILEISPFGSIEISDGDDGEASRTKRKAFLDSRDPLFEALRDLNFARACESLRERSSAMRSEYRDMRNASGNPDPGAGADFSAGGPSGGPTGETSGETPGGPSGGRSISEIGGFVKKMKANVRPGSGLDLHIAVSRRLLESTGGDAAFRRARFAEVLDSERLCVEGSSTGGLAANIQANVRGLNLRGAGRDVDAAPKPPWDVVYERVERFIFRGENVRRVARLLALAAVTFGGVPSAKQYDDIRREMVHAYGPPTVVFLQRMEDAGLLFRAEDASSSSNAGGSSSDAGGPRVRSGFSQTKRSLRLVMDEIDPLDPKDIAYAYSHIGYAPLSVRLVLAAVDGAWSRVEDSLRRLPGPHFEYAPSLAAPPGSGPAVTEAVPARRDSFDARVAQARRDGTTAKDVGGGSGSARVSSGKDDPEARKRRRPVVLVFFIGGVTRAEISCLRFASRKMNAGCDFVIGATKLVNGWNMIDSLIDDPRSFDPLDRDPIEPGKGI
jgi:hypothetical protein